MGYYKRLIRNFFSRSARDLRRKLRLSQEEMASKMQVSRVTIANWESYKTKMSEADLQMYASICGFPRDYIFLPY